MGDVVIGGYTFPVYGDQAGAIRYLTGSITSQATLFLVSTAEQQARGMVTAAALLDRQRWVGVLTDPVTPQPLAWPRTDVTDPDGNEVDPATTPREIINASYELAALLVARPATANQASTVSNIESVTAGPVNVSFASPTSGSAATRFPIGVQELIDPYLADESETTSSGFEFAFGGISTGECAESSFNDSDRYRLR